MNWIPFNPLGKFPNLLAFGVREIWERGKGPLQPIITYIILPDLKAYHDAENLSPLCYLSLLSCFAVRCCCFGNVMRGGFPPPSVRNVNVAKLFYVVICFVPWI